MNLDIPHVENIENVKETNGWVNTDPHAVIHTVNMYSKIPRGSSSSVL